jgi:hypothetical protein
MLNAEFFRKDFEEHVRAKGGNPIVEFALSSGLTFRVGAIVGIEAGWVALDVYPISGLIKAGRVRLQRAILVG